MALITISFENAANRLLQMTSYDHHLTAETDEIRKAQQERQQ